MYIAFAFKSYGKVVYSDRYLLYDITTCSIKKCNGNTIAEKRHLIDNLQGMFGEEYGNPVLYDPALFNVRCLVNNKFIYVVANGGLYWWYGGKGAYYVIKPNNLALNDLRGTEMSYNQMIQRIAMEVT